MSRGEKEKERKQQLRAAAEAELAKRAPGLSLNAGDTQRLLLELQLHQIELEMQNEALRHSQNELEVSRDRYADLYDFAPVGYLTLNPDGMIAEINLTGVKLLGKERKHLLQKRFSALVTPGHRDRWTQFFLSVKKLDGKGRVELALQRGDGATFQALLDCERSIVAVGDTAIRVVLTDITELKLVEMRLREGEQHFRTLANCGSALVWTSGVDKLCNYFNEPWLRFTGRLLEQELGNGWAEGVHPDDFELCLQTYVTAFDQRKPFSMDYRLRHVDGLYRWISDDGNPRYDSEGTFLGYIGYCMDITERKRVELLLRESEQRFHGIADHTPDLITRVDREGRFEYVNRAAESILGLAPQACIGMSAFDFVHPEDRAATQEAFASWLEFDGAVLEFENRLVGRGGDVHVLQWNVVAFRDASGQIVGFNSLARNVTQARFSEKQRLDSEERYRLIFEMSDDAIFLTNPENGSILAANPAACTMFGFSQEELCNLGPHDIIDSSDTRLSALVTKRRRNGHIRSRLRFVKRNGDVFTADMGSVEFRDSKGRLRAVVQLRDMSEQRRTQRALREGEMRWQFALESHRDAMWDWDASKDELFLTPAASELFNLPDTDLKRPIGDLLARVFEEDQALVQGQIDDVIAGKTSEWRGECRLSVFGQAPRWIATRGRVMTRGAHGESQRIVSISRDVTESKLKEADDRRQRELIAQQGRLVLLGELASALAHEINQPLTAIAGFAAACARKVDAIPEAQELAHAIEDQAIRAGQIVLRMRGFARRQRVGRTPVSLSEVISGVVKWVRMDSNYSDVVIDVTGVGSTLPAVIADRVELEQVLVNLVRNGIEAGQPNANEYRIALAACVGELPGQIEVSVTDWGKGLPANMNLNTLLPFTSSKEEGLGLGLTICRSIIEGHAGHLWATPNLGSGTIFHFTLPIANQVVSVVHDEVQATQLPLSSSET